MSCCIIPSCCLPVRGASWHVRGRSADRDVPPTQMRRSRSQPPDPARQMPEVPRQRLSQPNADRPTRSPGQLPQIEPNDQTRGVRSVSRAPPEATPSPPKPSRAQSVSAPRRVASKEEGGRQMFDKNELRSMHKSMFEAAIARRRSQLLSKADAAEQSELEATLAVVQVYMRKRPISEKESQVRGDYDALTVVPRTPVSKEVVLHNCQFQADLKTPFITHAHFGFDCVFPEESSNEEVYAQTAEPLVQIALNGGIATMFMFGQTGSGKTFTMTAMEEFAARDIFARTAEAADDFMSLQFFELRGNRCFDLLTSAAAARDTRAAARNRGAQAPELRLREMKDGTYVADGALVMGPTSPEDLCTWMRRAHACRATSATEANDVSSRSHAVCMLRFAQTGGQLLLIDCAGTERRQLGREQLCLGLSHDIGWGRF